MRHRPGDCASARRGRRTRQADRHRGQRCRLGKDRAIRESVYASAEGGAIAFTKSLAREMARFNINVNCVCPGPTDTPLLAAVPERHREAFVRATPMQRLAKPSEIADAVLFFANSRADFITGQVLSVSGGLTMIG
ncbi:MAG: SDR family oxidoreductase [Burkholderiales bacterium]